MIDWLVNRVRKMELTFEREVPALRSLARSQVPKDAQV